MNVKLIHIWPRLAWKEMRESWAMLAISLTLPLALIVIDHLWPEWLTSAGRGLMLDLDLLICSLLMTLWSVDRVHNKGLLPAKSRTQLPISQPVRWTATMLLPLPIPVLAGIMQAVLVYSYSHIVFSWAFWIMVLGMVTNFLLSTVLTALLTPILAIVGGVGWVIALCSSYYMGAQWDGPEYSLLLRGIAAAVLASLIWEFCARRKWYLPGRLVAVAALLCILLNPVKLLADMRTMTGSRAILQPGSHYEEFCQYETPDHALALNGICNVDTRFPLAPETSYELIYQDRRNGIRKVRQFNVATGPLAIVGQTRALFLQVPPPGRQCSLLEWDTRTDQVRELLYLPAQAGDLAQFCFASAAPDGRNLLLGIHSQRGSGMDIWLIDLVQQQSALVLADVDAFYSNQPVCTWRDDHVVLATGSGMARVELAPMHARYVDFAYPTGSARRSKP